MLMKRNNKNVPRKYQYQIKSVLSKELQRNYKLSSWSSSRKTDQQGRRILLATKVSCFRDPSFVCMCVCMCVCGGDRKNRSDKGGNKV